MNRSIGLLTFVVPDYDQAIRYFCDVLDFDLVEDKIVESAKRWVVVKPKGGVGAGLLLAKAAGDRQAAAIGEQAGGRVFLFLDTDNFSRDFSEMRDRGVDFVEAPRSEKYGVVAKFRDAFGNLWDLIERCDA